MHGGRRLKPQSPNKNSRGRRAAAAFSTFLTAFLTCGSAFAEPGLSSIPLDLSRYEGKVIYLDFWASWCGPCAQSFPYMKSLEAKYKDKGLVILAVNVDRSRNRADEFIKRTNSTLPVVFDPKGEIAKSLEVKTMPTAILIDRSGKIRFIHAGFKTEDQQTYTSHVQELLNAK